MRPMQSLMEPVCLPTATEASIPSRPAEHEGPMGPCYLTAETRPPLPSEGTAAGPSAFAASEIERLLKVNQDLQRVARAQAVAWPPSPERPSAGGPAKAWDAEAGPWPRASQEWLSSSPLRQSRLGSLYASPGSEASVLGTTRVLSKGGFPEASGTLSAEKEALASKLKAEELLQIESVRLATQAEARLAQVATELETLRRTPLHSGDGLERLRQQLQTARADCDSRQRRMADYESSLQRSSSALASLRADRELAISDHGRLREEALVAREQLESRIHSLKSARAAISSRSQRNASGGHKLFSPAREQKADAQHTVAELEEEQKLQAQRLATTRQVLTDLQREKAQWQATVAKFQASNDERTAVSQRAIAQDRQEAQAAARLLAEREKETQRLRASMQRDEAQLFSAQAVLAQQGQRESEAKEAEERRQAEEMQEAETTLWALRSRQDDALAKLQEEQEKNHRFRQGVLSLQAAKDHAVKKRLEADLVREFPHYDEGARLGVRRLEAELEELRRWKEEAAASVQRMTLGLRSLRDQYDKEVQIGQALQHAWEQKGLGLRQLRPAVPGPAPWWRRSQEAEPLTQGEQRPRSKHKAKVKRGTGARFPGDVRDAGASPAAQANPSVRRAPLRGRAGVPARHRVMARLLS